MASAYIFDLDGVVTDTAELHYRAWQRLADQHGLPFDREKNEQLKGVSRVESLTIMLAGQACSETAFAAMLKSKNQDYVSSLNQLGPGDILPGMGELIEQLRIQNIPIAIASASKNARAILERIGLHSRFDAISDGHSVANSKPAPDVFIHAAGQLRQRCADCTVIEDAAAGVEAARAAGMGVVGVGAHLESAQPDQWVNSTLELSGILL